MKLWNQTLEHSAIRCLHRQEARPCILKVCPNPQASLSLPPCLGKTEHPKEERGHQRTASLCWNFTETSLWVACIHWSSFLGTFLLDGTHQESSGEETGGSRLLQNGLSWILCVPGIGAISAVCCMGKIAHKEEVSVPLVQPFSFYTEYMANCNILLYHLKTFSGKLIIWCINTKNI